MQPARRIGNDRASRTCREAGTNHQECPLILPGVNNLMPGLLSSSPEAGTHNNRARHGVLRIPPSSSPAPGEHKGPPSNNPRHGAVQVLWVDNSPGMLPRRRHPPRTPGPNSRPQRHGSNKGRKVINLLPRRTEAVAQVNRGDNQRKLPINGVSPLSNRHKAVGLRPTRSHPLQPRQGVMHHGSNKGKALDRGSKGLVQDRMKALRRIGPCCAAVPEPQEA